MVWGLYFCTLCITCGAVRRTVIAATVAAAVAVDTIVTCTGTAVANAATAAVCLLVGMREVDDSSIVAVESGTR
jgi:hypothetical protein